MTGPDDIERDGEYKRIAKSMVDSFMASHDARAERTAREGLIGAIILIVFSGLLIWGTYQITPERVERLMGHSQARPQ